ncbi:glutamate-rich WD repeat-containing protein 1 [Aplysia californica]|uniref:Glutamate-rich WD repeat-containing protein 1 n=1 Tax=Aplysia californica TaxID=6500 RepID=A0ABM0K6X6_APLCA|nr:glutamate-rich WD repeat-containing protein 1 [Aplysia californica]
MADEPMEATSVPKKKGKKKQKKKSEPESSVFIPGRGQIEEDEELIVDESAYVMLHQATTGDPCLSFEVLQDGLGRRESFPCSSYLLGGTQSEAGHFNYILLMKMYNMHKTQVKEKNPDKESDEEDSEEEEEEDEGMSDEESENKAPQLRQTYIKHNGCVNRIKSTTVNDHVLSASWSEHGVVFVFDVTAHVNVLDGAEDLKEFESSHSQVAPLFSFSGHQIEGYALSWSKLDPGRLLSGDCNKNIFLWKPTNSSWEIDQRPFVGHTASVEDIKWSPKENNVFMTCSVDKSLRVWDARASPDTACKLVASEAHMRDINVIDWSENEPLIISGGDDGLIKIWDLRKFTSGVEVAVFEHHKGPITSVEWNPLDSSVFVASGSDDQVSIWDVAVERDEGAASVGEEPDVPPQLLFMHLGQKDIKEVHWHPQVPGLVFSTAQSGFNVFKTISV